MAKGSRDGVDGVEKVRLLQSFGCKSRVYRNIILLLEGIEGYTWCFTKQ
jgi:hypothetical protein